VWPPFKLLLQGIDTLECAYYLHAGEGCTIDFERLTARREELRQARGTSRGAAMSRSVLAQLPFAMHTWERLN
jgi:hypothetical protein